MTRMSLRRFLRGGYQELEGPTEVHRRGEPVFTVTPAALAVPAVDTTPDGRPPSLSRDEAYRRLQRRPRA